MPRRGRIGTRFSNPWFSEPPGTTLGNTFSIYHPRVSQIPHLVRHSFALVGTSRSFEAVPGADREITVMVSSTWMRPN